ncbi:MAG: hypothetical protein AAF517_00720 [Planctomycetota bacterium]
MSRTCTRRSRFTCVCVFALVSVKCFSQEFRLSVDAPENVHSLELFDTNFVLTSSAIPGDERGVEAWQIAVSHENLALISASTEGTVVDELLSGGFEETEITSGPGNEGFTSVVVLSLGVPITLPPSGDAVIATARYQVPSRSCFREMGVLFADGLEGTGLPVETAISWQGASFLPAVENTTFDGCELADYRLSLVPSADSIAVTNDERPMVEVDVVVEQSVPSVAGWTLAVEHDSDSLDLIEVMLPASIESLFEDDGFALLEITRGPSNEGFVASVELSAAVDAVLPVGPHSVARAVYQPAKQPEKDLPTEIAFTESLRGSGGLVSNSVSPRGSLELAGAATITLRNGIRTRFVRGDANSDSQLDIADPIFSLSHLFLGGPIPACIEAANTNSQGDFDLSDVVFSLNYLFTGGPQPGNPFPDCGSIEREIECEVTPCA